jgi:hypothetical protein
MTQTTANIVTVSIAADAGTEIVVTDDRRMKVASGAGKLSLQLSAGLYKVRFKAGGAHSDQLFEVSDQPLQLQSPRLEIGTPVPLAGTITTHEYQEDGARNLAGVDPQKIGQGSELALFARDSLKKWQEGPPAEPWRGLVLQRLSGITDVDFSDCGLRDPDRGYAAARVELDPGTYLLTLVRKSGPILQLPVVASAGWRTTVFTDCAGPSTEREADLYGASVIVSRPTDNFEPYDDVLRMAELAKQSLLKGRVSVDAESIANMLQSKFTYPMIGILAGHVLLLAEKPNLSLLRVVVNNLETLVPGHPDVLALRVALSNEDPTMRMEDIRVSGPPMLRSSWDILVEASGRLPLLLPVNAEWMQYTCSLSGSRVWLAWQRPPATPPAGLNFVARPESFGIRKPEWNKGMASVFQVLNRNDPLETVLRNIMESAKAILATSDGKLDKKEITATWEKFKYALSDVSIATNPVQNSLRRKLLSLLEDADGDPNDESISLGKLARDLRVPVPVLIEAAHALFSAVQNYLPPAGHYSWGEHENLKL